MIDSLLVQGRSRVDRELLDTAALVGHLVPAGSVYGFLAEHRRRVFPEGLFADLFRSGLGRASVPGEVIASVLVLRTLQHLSDGEAMEALRCDIRWKVACGLPIDHPRFHPTTLVVWRNRLQASGRPERILLTFQWTGEMPGWTLSRRLPDAANPHADVRSPVSHSTAVRQPERGRQNVSLASSRETASHRVCTGMPPYAGRRPFRFCDGSRAMTGTPRWSARTAMVRRGRPPDPDLLVSDQGLCSR